MDATNRFLYKPDGSISKIAWVLLVAGTVYVITWFIGLFGGVFFSYLIDPNLYIFAAVPFTGGVVARAWQMRAEAGQGVFTSLRKEKGKTEQPLLPTFDTTTKKTPAVNDITKPKGRWVTLLDGSLIPLHQWQTMYGVAPDKVGKYFSLSENKWNYPDWVVSEAVIRVLDKSREMYGAPWIVTSLFRPGNTGSAHGYGMAVDSAVVRIDSGKLDNQGKPIKYIDTSDGQKKAKILKDAAKELGYSIRIAWNSYWAKDLACIHLDVAPMYFSQGKPWQQLEIRPDIKQKFTQVGENNW